jgi:4-amino-4-deoxy-L-arabinose transferase-like glycosyltransferase
MNEKIISKLLTLASNKWKIAYLFIAIFVSTLPFLNQAVHIDDPVFLQTARNVINNPLDPYDSETNWLGTPEKLFDFVSSPPLFSYYLAVVITILGETERALHLACLPFSLIAGFGMFFLSRRFGAPALASALFLVFSPIFLTMSHTLMPDVAMCAFAICGVLYFIRGYDGDKPFVAIFGALLAGLASLLRYNGIIAPVMIFLYIVIHFHKEKIKYSISLFIPGILFAGWNLFTLKMYGTMHFLHHIRFQKYGEKGINEIILHFLPHLMFIAACFPMLFLILLWKKRSAVVMIISLAYAFTLTVLIQGVTHYAAVNLLLVFIIACGASAFFSVSAKDLMGEWKSGFPRDSIFLVLWLISILWMHNWGIHPAAKYMITALPPVIIISLRNIGQFIGPKQIATAIVFTILFGFMTASADFRLANVYRTMANDAAEQTARFTSRRYFTGHWGFQYYMEKNNASAYPEMAAVHGPAIISRVSLACPQSVHPESEMKLKMIFQKIYNDNFPFRTMSNSSGFQANFYSSIAYLSGKGPEGVYGVLPFSLSRAPLETLTIYGLK